MGISLTDAAYYGIILGDTGNPRDISQYISSLSWEEAKGELSMKATFTARDAETQWGHVSEFVTLGSLFIIAVTIGGETREVFRGKVESWNPSTSFSNETLRATCYDDLFPIQKSQDNYIVKKNTSASKAIKKLFKAWELPIGLYEGPTIKLPKMIFQARYIADIATDMLNKAYDKGDEKCFMRAADGVIDILPYMDTYDIYFFNGDNSIQIDERRSTENIVTRVKIMDEKGEKKKATVDGLTEYGIRQVIKNLEQDQKLKDAKAEAEQIIDTKGKVERSITLQTPDIPFLRKGDLIYCDIRGSVGYYDVAGVSHNADSRTMTMDIEFSEANAYVDDESAGEKRKKKYVRGDIVQFRGGEYHMTSKASSKTFRAPAGRAKISRIAKKRPYPYKLVHTSAPSTVNGWVTADQFY